LHGTRFGGDPLSTPPLSAPAATLPRIFTRDDGRDRVAVPFWNGVLSAIGAVAIVTAALFVVMIILLLAVVLVTGRMPSLNAGHPLLATSEAIAYACGGWFAWRRLKTTGLRPFRAITRGDVRVIFIGLAALVLARIGTGIQLVLTHQTKHVQSGLEHFNVVTSIPLMTAIGITVGVLSMVLLAPVVEEITFRGLLFGALAPRLGVLASALITAVMFGAVHGDLVLFPTLAVLGLINALAYAATGNLWVPITLHAFNNSLGAIALVATSLQHH
jgi:membrane protease YdiL (CAAX protease family)